VSKYTAVITLYPGEFDKPWCTVWVEHRGGHVMRADTTVPTRRSADEPQDVAAVQAQADALLMQSRYHRTGDWQTVRYSLQAPCILLSERQARKLGLLAS
jgi:hypothetical protein